MKSNSTSAQPRSILTTVRRALYLFGALLATSLPIHSAARRVADLNPGPDGSYPSNFVAFGGGLYFSAYNDTVGRELWRYDGTGVTLVSNINDTVRDIGFGVLVGNDSAPVGMTLYRSALYFSAYDARRGGELWRTDGTNTVRAADINPDANNTVKVSPANSWPKELTPLGTKLYFAANNGTTLLNYELWGYDGASAAQAANVHPDLGLDHSSYPQGLVAWNGSVYCQADDAVNGYELVRFLPGTGARTININPGDANSGSFPKYFTPFADALYFQAYHSASGFELWKTDGTTASLVTNLAPGTAGSFPEGMTVFNGALYFRATDGVRGFELWKYDGISASLAADINPAGDSFAKNFTVFQNRLYFSANDGVHGWELWSYDGATATPVADLNPAGDSFPEQLTVAGGALYFVATTPETGYEVWKFDGAEANAVTDLNPGPGNSYPQGLTVFNHELCFRAAGNGTSDWEFWALPVGSSPPNPVRLLDPRWVDGRFVFSFGTEVGRSYRVQSAGVLDGNLWQGITNVVGDGSVISVTHDAPSGGAPARFYRVESR